MTQTGLAGAGLTIRSSTQRPNDSRQPAAYYNQRRSPGSVGGQVHPAVYGMP